VVHNVEQFDFLLTLMRDLPMENKRFTVVLDNQEMTRAIVNVSQLLKMTQFGDTNSYQEKTCLLWKGESSKVPVFTLIQVPLSGLTP
jgi:hypothetical protein